MAVYSASLPMVHAQRPRYIRPNEARLYRLGALLWSPGDFEQKGRVYRRGMADGFYTATYNGTSTLSGTVNGPSHYLPGATTAYVSFGTDASLTGFTEFTLAAWCYWIDFSGSFPMIAARGQDPTGRDYIWYIHGGATQNMAIELYPVAGGSDNLTSAVGHVVTAGRWHHCVMSAKASTHQKLYVDGREIATRTPSNFTIRNFASDPLTLGRHSTSALYPMNGHIADFILADRAWTAGEVREQFDHRTRWSHYYRPTRRVFFNITAGAQSNAPRYLHYAKQRAA